MLGESLFGSNDTNDQIKSFAKQDCEMKWASWTYDGYSVSVCHDNNFSLVYLYIFLPTITDKRFSRACVVQSDRYGRRG